MAVDEKGLSEIKETISSVDAPAIGELPFELFEKQGNRTTKLLATSGDVQPIEGRRRWYGFKLKEPVLVTRVVAQVSGYHDFSDFEFSLVGRRGKAKGDCRTTV